MKFNIREMAKHLLEPGQTLSQRAARGGVWVFGGRIAQRGIDFVRLVVLARLLMPEDFGIVGVALLAVSVSGIFSETGFRLALVQRKGDIREFLDTTWVVSVMRGVILGAILFGIAPFVAQFFGNSMVSPVLRVIAISCILEGLTNIGIVYFQKELEFRKQFIYELSGSIADIAVSITVAIILQNVWALVFGLLAGRLVSCIVSYIIHPYRPRFRFQLRQAKELFVFGKWLLASSIVVFLVTQGDDAFLGKILGLTTLGFYQMAFRFGNLPNTEIGAIGAVAFPTYSKIQDNISLLKDTYLRILRLISFAAIPIAGGLFMLAPHFTHIFLGDKWMPIVPALMIFAVSATIKIMVGSANTLYNAVGKPRLSFKMTLATLIALAATIYPLTMLWGLSGTALAVLISYCITIPIRLYYLKKIAGISAIEYKSILLPPLLGVIVMCVVIFGIGRFTDQFQVNWFVASIFIGAATYLGIAFLFDKISSYPIFKEIRFIIKSVRS